MVVGPPVRIPHRHYHYARFERIRATPEKRMTGTFPRSTAARGASLRVGTPPRFVFCPNYNLIFHLSPEPAAW